MKCTRVIRTDLIGFQQVSAFFHQVAVPKFDVICFKGIWDGFECIFRNLVALFRILIAFFSRIFVRHIKRIRQIFQGTSCSKIIVPSFRIIFVFVDFGLPQFLLFFVPRNFTHFFCDAVNSFFLLCECLSKNK